MNSTNSWIEEMTARATSSKEHLKGIVRRLNELGFHGTFTVTYSGSGDSGSIEEPNGLSEMPEVAGAIEAMGYSWDYDKNDNTIGLLGLIDDALPGGWEINDGSSGEVVFNIDTMTVTIEHDEVVMDTHRSTFEL